VDAVHGAQTTEVIAQSRPFRLPAADAEIHVVALRKDPAVPARNHAELEDELAAVSVLERRIPLEGDAVSVLVTRDHRPRGDAVHAVSADDDARANPFAVNDDVAVVERRSDAVAELGARLLGLPREELVEAPALRHEAERPRARALEGLAVVETQLEAIDDVLYDGIDREGQLPRRPDRHSAAARLVAWEPRLVDEEDRRTCDREPVSRSRARGAGADHDDVEGAHKQGGYNGRLVRGGVPERPKGAVCKTVGSAYAGSNPPAPIQAKSSGLAAVSRRLFARLRFVQVPLETARDRIVLALTGRNCPRSTCASRAAVFARSR